MKRKIKQITSIIVGFCICAMVVSAGVFAGTAINSTNFNLGIRFDPTVICALEIKDNSTGDFITIFNNKTNEVNDAYIDNYSGTTLNLKELTGTTFYFKLTNLNSANNALAIQATLTAGASTAISELTEQNQTSPEFAITLENGGLGTRISVVIQEVSPDNISILAYAYETYASDIEQGDATTYWAYDANGYSTTKQASIPTEPKVVDISNSTFPTWDLSSLTRQGGITSSYWENTNTDTYTLSENPLIESTPYIPYTHARYTFTLILQISSLTNNTKNIDVDFQIGQDGFYNQLNDSDSFYYKVNNESINKAIENTPNSTIDILSEEVSGNSSKYLKFRIEYLYVAMSPNFTYCDFIHNCSLSFNIDNKEIFKFKFFDVEVYAI